ncbi:sugar ABC transporter permease [Sinomonas soli]
MTLSQEVAAAPASHDDRESAWTRFWSRARQFRLGPVLVVLVLVWAFFALQNPRFLAPVNLSNLTLQTAVTATIALGLVFVLLLGEIDLSVAALSGVAAAVTSGLATNNGWNPVAAAALGLGLGVAWSLVQAVIVLYGAPSFIVTLAGSLALGGVLLLALPRSGQISIANSPLGLIAGSYLPALGGWAAALVAVLVSGWFYLSRHRARRAQGLPTQFFRTAALPILSVLVLSAVLVLTLNAHRGVPVIFAALVAVVGFFAYITTQTRFGVRLYSVGGNREAARRAGIPVGKTILWAFALSGFFAALGGIFAASRLLGVSNQSGSGTLLLQAIAAAVIGGTSLFGGKGTVWSALLGALLIGSISNGMDLLGLATEIKDIVTGIILVAATVADVVLSRGTFSWRKK